MVDFAGYQMPLRYSSEIQEHLCVRNQVGLFDVSHMGDFLLYGPQALTAADFLLSNSISTLNDGQAAYSLILNAEAGIIDDVIAYKIDRENVFLCVNAANRAKDYAWLSRVLKSSFNSDQANLLDKSDDCGQLALQGPHAQNVIRELFAPSTTELKPFHFVSQNNFLIARTGYTGEDGFEIYGYPKDIQALWIEFMSLGIRPCGLACRDTLRLEAGYCLYGNEIDENTNPKEAGLWWTVKMAKEDFIGKAALFNIQAKPPNRCLVGLKMLDKGLARKGYPILDEQENKVGIVTSGTISPSLDCGIALAYVPLDMAQVGYENWIVVRDKKIRAQVVSKAFYKTKKVQDANKS